MNKLFNGILMAALFIPFNANAQNKSELNELSVSYGIIPATQLLDNFTITATDEHTGGHYQSNNSKCWGALSIGYSYNLSKTIRLGLTYSFSQINEDIVLGSSSALGAKNDTYNVLMPNVKFYWLMNNNITLYSRGGAGVVFAKSEQKFDNSQQANKTENKTIFAWQASPLGIEIGRSKIVAFAEAGIGYMGSVQVGALFRF
jgi:opacity protein-like surface antigen